jgi:hypothetical protein
MFREMSDMSNDAAWQAFIRFSKYGFIPKDDREPWDIITRPRPAKRMHKRRVTLARAMRQASKAGVAVNGATVNVDGSVTLMFGETANGSGENGNPWDEVLTHGGH